MAIVQDAFDTSGIETTNHTHPFFQKYSIPHQSLTLTEAGEGIDFTPLPKEIDHSHSRKNKARSLGQAQTRTQAAAGVQYLSIDGSINDPKSKHRSGSEQTMDIPTKPRVLKINANGKLLSSPSVAPTLPAGIEKSSAASMSPATTNIPNRKRVKCQRSSSNPPSIVAKIAYGSVDVQSRSRVGQAINTLLGQPRRITSAAKSSSPEKKEQKSTHPFFGDQAKGLSGLRVGARSNEDRSSRSPDVPSRSGKGCEQETSPAAEVLGSKEVLSRQSNANSVQRLPAPWPPTDMQRVGDLCTNVVLDSSAFASSVRTSKSKSRVTYSPQREDPFHLVPPIYCERRNLVDHCTPRLPARRVLSGRAMADEFGDRLSTDQIHPATRKLKSSLATSLTAFDQGRCEQISWTTKSSPCTAEEVLQLGPEPLMLRDWVKNLTVTSVEGAQPTDKVRPVKPRGRKRGRPKLSGDEDDFLISSEDEANELVAVDELPKESSPFVSETKGTVLRTGAMNSSQDRSQIKNVILLSGPAGCGKTASVYAVAKELGFEVFEMHPGMRRGARDILEKVGDMTHNHLVQQQSGDGSGGETSEIPIDDDVVQDEIASGKQRTMRGFFEPQLKKKAKIEKKRKAVLQDQKSKEAVKKRKKAQKQSLILLEEVDLLFDEDKSFWSGVMSLIELSKRPIILTCNDEANLPLDELPLHGILRYSSAPETVATDYLLTLAASQGHDLQREAVAFLYRSKAHDLRATISELGFWCQMGIGSRKGGLDWMPNVRYPNKHQNGDNSRRQRILSANTYVKGMDLAPNESAVTGLDQLLYDAHHYLDLPIDNWIPERGRILSAATIKDVCSLTDSYSDLDNRQQIFSQATLLNEDRETKQSNLHLKISISQITRLLPPSNRPTQSTILDTHNSKMSQQDQSRNPLTLSTLAQILSPLQSYRPTFPVSQIPGRQSPSLDCPRSDVMIGDIAPYVRSIVAFEERWGGSVVAAPGSGGNGGGGGSSSILRRSTRTSTKNSGMARHFSKALDGRHVLMTGGDGWAELSLCSGSEEDLDGEKGTEVNS